MNQIWPVACIPSVQFIYHFISKHLGLTTIFDIMECAPSPEHNNSELNLLFNVS